jgi:hypothetical protein
MTLVAAFRIENVPVILGDLLITEEPSTLPHHLIPTRPDLTRRSSTSKDRRRTGMLRKVLLVNERLVVAFTGTVAAGAVLFADLQRRFHDKAASQEELNFALQLFNNQLLGRASLVGWLADPEPQCFTWTAKPGPVQWVKEAFLGSGARHFSTEIMPTNHFGGSENFTPVEFARFVAITKAAGALSNELSSAGTFQNSYGYGLEVAAWNGHAFEFEPSITFAFYNVLLGPGAQNRFQPAMLRIYKHHDRYSVLQTQILADTIGPYGSVGRHSYLDFVRSLHDDGNDIELSNQPLDPHSPVYSFGWAWSHIDSGKAGFMNFTVDDSRVQIEGDNRKFNLILLGTNYFFDEIRKIVASS